MSIVLRAERQDLIRRPPTATITDVVRLAGVGKMTVSRVLNGASHVGPETAKRVQQAIHMLRYRPNQAAQALQTHRTKMIGLIVPRFNRMQRDRTAYATVPSTSSSECSPSSLIFRSVFIRPNLPFSLSVDAAYVGTTSRNLIQGLNLNPVSLGADLKAAKLRAATFHLCSRPLNQQHARKP
jgi:hypothetical protein